MKTILSGLCLSLSCSSALAFDATVFQTLDQHTTNHAREFLSLPADEAKDLALRHVKQTDKTAYPWQVFLLTYLSNQPESDETWKALADESLLAELTGESYSQHRQVDKKLAKSGEQVADLCFRQLQQPVNTEISDTQREQFTLLQRSCVPRLKSIIGRDEVFDWYLAQLAEEGGLYNGNLLALFEQRELLNRLFFGEKQGVDIAELSADQQQRYLDVLISYFVGQKKDHSLGPWMIGNQIKRSDEAFRKKFVLAAENSVTTDLPDDEALQQFLKGLLGIESEESSQAFWRLVWGTPSFAEKTSVVNAVLKESFNSDYADENFPEVLSEAALEYIRENKDIRSASYYMYLIADIEGGTWNEEHLEIAKVVDDIVGELPADDETQRVLKYVYLSAATIQSFVSIESLTETNVLLDKAYAIDGEPLSWYVHLSGEKEDKLFQHADFKSIKALYENKQLTGLADWVEHKKKPEKPLITLPLDLYALFIKATPKYRIWHDADNGHALLLDDEGKLHYFDGYQAEKDYTSGFEVYQLKTGETPDISSTPTLTSSMDEWIEHAFKYFSGNVSDAGELPIRNIGVFADKEQEPAEERLLFAELNDGELSTYPDYLEYIRYGNEIILNADIEQSIRQYLLIPREENAAQQWMNQLSQTAPANTQATGLWYKSSGKVVDEEQGLMIREYVHPDDEKDTLTLSALHAGAGFDYGEGCVSFDPKGLAEQSNGYFAAELKLFQQGYYLDRIYHNEGCLPASIAAKNAEKSGAETIEASGSADTAEPDTDSGN